MHISPLRLFAAAAACSLAAAAPLPAPSAQTRMIMPWLCLEDCGASASAIAAQLRQLATPGVFTAASFEDFDLALNGTVYKKSPRTRVSGALRALGLQTHAMIVSWDLDAIRAAFAAPAAFIDSIVTNILDAEGAANITAINLDFEPHGSAPPVGPVPTPADGAAYVAFLNTVADALHARGVLVSVDIATWTAFWDYQALGASRVDWLCDMESYNPDLAAFKKQVAFASATLPPEKYVVGLETHPSFNVSDVAERFAVLRSAGLRKIAIWATPMPDMWMPFLEAF